jgi:hypothetical protein
MHSFWHDFPFSPFFDNFETWAMFLYSPFLCMRLSMYSRIFLERGKIMKNARSLICGVDGE